MHFTDKSNIVTVENRNETFTENMLQR